MWRDFLRVKASNHCLSNIGAAFAALGDDILLRCRGKRKPGTNEPEARRRLMAKCGQQSASDEEKARAVVDEIDGIEKNECDAKNLARAMYGVVGWSQVGKVAEMFAHMGTLFPEYT